MSPEIDEPHALEFCPPIKREARHLLPQDIVDRCMEPGLDRAAVASQVRKYASKSLLRPVGVDEDDGRKPFLYEFDSVLIAKALSTLGWTTLHIVADSEGPDTIAREVSTALKGFNLSDFFPQGVPKGLNVNAYLNERGGSPARRILMDWADGIGGWSLHVRWFIDDATGKRRVRCKVWNAPKGFMPSFMPDPEPLPHAEIIVPFDRLLPVITANRKGMN